MNIREAQCTDSEGISQLVYKLTEKYIAPDCTEDGADILLRSMRREAIEGYLESGYIYHIAEIDYQIVGVIGVRDNSHVHHLFVDDAYHKQGIARKLWHVARETCLSNGDVGVFTVNSSRYALSFYERLGFVQQSSEHEEEGVVYIPMQLTIDRQ
jgi:GNAT superfamily N-acetyltransferase